MFKFLILASCMLMLSLTVNSFKLDLDELERQRIFSEVCWLIKNFLPYKISL
jgi:hypothetical protein